MPLIPIQTSPTLLAPPATVINRGRSALLWMAVGCALLAISGVARGLQDRRHEVETNYTEACPFELKTLPTMIGGWKLSEAGDLSLDKETMRITGGTEHLMRTYVDEMTGVSLVVLVLFGPVEPVIPHTPEICYPSSGFMMTEDLADHLIKPVEENGITNPITFRSAVYAKSGGRATLREGVYYSFRLEGKWSPDAGSGRKFPRKNPSVFKVQIQRRVAENERRDKIAVDPIEQFLSHFVPAIEHEIQKAAKAPKVSMGEVGPGLGGGPTMTKSASSLSDHPGEDNLLASLTMGRKRPGFDQAIHDHRSATDQEDQKDHGREVKSQGDLQRPSNRISRLGTLLAGFRRGTIRVMNHERISWSEIDPRETLSHRFPNPVRGKV